MLVCAFSPLPKITHLRRKEAGLKSRSPDVLESKRLSLSLHFYGVSQGLKTRNLRDSPEARGRASRAGAEGFRRIVSVVSIGQTPEKLAFVSGLCP